MATHLAAVSLAKGEPFEVHTRPTPKPGPGELLIEIKSVALNPADGHMRDRGLFISTYPTVIGFDISGLVLEVGDNVPIGATDEDTHHCFRPGITRVAAYAASFWRSCDPDHGAFQERCLVPWQHAVPSRRVFLGTKQQHCPSPLNVGTMGVQSARLLREDRDSSFAAVYATAGAANMKYIGTLGADRVFDYNEPQVVDAIVATAREDGLVIRHCFLATGQLAPCQAVLKAFVGDNNGQEKLKAKIASAPIIPPDAEEVNGVETIFVMPSTDEGERLDQFRYWMGTWLRENLVKGTIRPSPEPKVVGKALGAINIGLDMLWQGAIYVYAKLDNLTDRLAAELLQLSGKLYSFLPIMCHKSALAVAAMLAAWKSGAAFALIDPNLPRERQESVLTQLRSGAVFIPTNAERNNLLPAFMREQAINTMLLTPSVLQMLNPAECPTVKTVFTGGEKMSALAIEKWSSQVRLMNAYGPTETAVLCFPCDRVTSLTSPEKLGWALGAVGKLVVCGLTLARGYLNDPTRTAAAFLDDPAWVPDFGPDNRASRRAYRTGDLVRYDDDGSVHIIGRKDQQIKLRGQRIELTEIELAVHSLLPHGDV
ncbi:GroES-like protein [Penicillium coprophilum]|uniref:GroES-like protein n=1 Tax=Penicillium coprophilum TaxID=36646 RepID=UPI00238BDDD0|nr:GroES-like protein [Penicillium coprophilum]KAJ5165612.1 GroES-like protein [Penicillium coprophilum]